MAGRSHLSQHLWLYLPHRSKRLGIQAFSAGSAAGIIGRDIERAAALAGAGLAMHLERLAEAVHAA
jgi:hypothetical protein